MDINLIVNLNVISMYGTEKGDTSALFPFSELNLGVVFDQQTKSKQWCVKHSSLYFLLTFGLHFKIKLNSMVLLPFM